MDIEKADPVEVAFEDINEANGCPAGIKVFPNTPVLISLSETKISPSANFWDELSETLEER